MKHARSDYDRIQDPAGLIPDDEPVFLIRGQDMAAVGTVLRWACIAEGMGAEEDIVAAARKQARAMEQWQNKHDRYHLPDMPAGAAP